MNTSHPYAHRTNPDGTIDSICKTCFITVGTDEEAAALRELQGAACEAQPGRLLRIRDNDQMVDLRPCVD